jgi:hypothetical protein
MLRGQNEFIGEKLLMCFFYEVDEYDNLALKESDMAMGIYKNFPSLDSKTPNSLIYQNRQTATAAALALGFPSLLIAIKVGAIVPEYINND